MLERLSDDLDGLGLTPGEINALFHIDETNGTRVAVLLDATGQRPSTLTGVVNRLEKRGLITREINPEDRRSFLLRLTPPGAAAAREVRGAFAALETEALDGAPSRTPQGFLAVLHALDNACRPQIEDRDLQTAAPLPGGRRRRRSRLRPGDR
ncbi:MAG: MarR family winged helix-turn-helix transcriptional regulator [Solirubrobacteraceae bacterium]